MSKNLSAEDIVEILREMVKESTQAQIADSMRISRSMLNEVLSGRRKVSSRIAKELGYIREISFRKVA